MFEELLKKLRRSITKAAGICLVAVVAAGTLLAQSAMAREFTITDLGTLGGNESYAVDINNSGQVIGNSTTFTGDTHAFIWENGVMTDLGTLGGNYSEAGEINDAGQVVGISTTADGKYHPFFWENGVMFELAGCDNTNPHTHAVHINNKGQVAGVRYIPGINFVSNSHWIPFIWENGVRTDLEEPPFAGTIMQITDMNDSGMVTAWHSHIGYAWIGGNYADIGTLGGYSSHPFAVNNIGQVVGFSAIPGNTYWHAFIWENGQMTDINPPGEIYSMAIDINEAGRALILAGPSGNYYSYIYIPDEGVFNKIGRVVTYNVSGPRYPNYGVDVNEPGQVAYTDFYTLASFWENGEKTVLPSLSLGARYTSAINDSTQIAGSSLKSGNLHAVLWNPVITRHFLCTSVSPAGTGTVSVSPASADGFYDKDTVVTVTAEAETGYAFTGWSDAASGTNATTTVVMDSDKCVTANFATLVTGFWFQTNFCDRSPQLGSTVPIVISDSPYFGGNTPEITISGPNSFVETGVFTSDPVNGTWTYHFGTEKGVNPPGDYTVSVTVPGVVFYPPLECTTTVKDGKNGK